MAKEAKRANKEKMVRMPVAVAPDARPLSALAAARLASVSGIPQQELVGKTTVQLADTLKWRIDPLLFGFRRICGRVVKRDPATGVDYPVPFATVHVQDTDCSFFGYFPPDWPWGWLLPFNCRREELATVVTDACGRFCVWIPWWDIDWILRWRRERICLPLILVRPTIWDLLHHLLVWPPIIHPIGPDPPPYVAAADPVLLASRRALDLLGPQATRMLETASKNLAAGTSQVDSQRLLAMPAFAPSLRPALPLGVQGILQPKEAGGTSPLAKQLNLRSVAKEQLGALRFIGPFFRCWDVWVPEWFPIFDVPDITFWVTQDVNGDGTQETIYSESFFDVRWNAGYIPDVTLLASEIARASPVCDTPPTECAKGAPFLQFVGLMPLVNPPVGDPYLDSASGYARRPNRPHLNGLWVDPSPNPLAKTPFTGTLQIYGCSEQAGAVYYRLRYSFNGSAPVPFTGLTWPVFRFVGGVLQTLWVAADANGWYPVLNPADGWFPDHLLLNWPTGQDGVYQVDLQLGNANKTVLVTSPTTGFCVDNSRPFAYITDLAWRVAGTSTWTPLERHCPVLVRPAGTAIEFRIGYIGSAAHFRSSCLRAWGCDGEAPAQEAAPAWSDPPSSVNPYQHWSTDPDTDNAVSRKAVYLLSGLAPQGAYRFHLEVDSRSFNPSGGDGGFQQDWNYKVVYNWNDSEVAVAVVDA